MSLPVRRSSRLFGRFVLFALLLAGGGGLAAFAQAPAPQRANFKQAHKYTGDFLKQFTYSLTVDPHWIGKSDIFWYEYRTSTGKHFVRVNPQQGTRTPLFDRVKLATQLSEMTKKPLEPAQLPLTRVSVSDDDHDNELVTLMRGAVLSDQV